MDLKELNSKSYSINAKYKKHTGHKIRYSQKSRNSIFCKEDKANRKCRIYAKREVNNHKKQELKNDMKNQNFNCHQKIVKSIRIKIDEW